MASRIRYFMSPEVGIHQSGSKTMPLIPHRFLFRFAAPCLYHKAMPVADDEDLFDLPKACRIDNFAGMDELKNFADVSLAWNEFGLGIQVEVRGKEKPAVGDASRPRGSDGVTLWLDTRDARAGHRASRTCHQFHFLVTGGGPDREEPACVASKIHRALEDAPLPNPSDIPLRVRTRATGYTLNAFLPAAVLQSFDPEQHPRLGFFYAVHDDELGEQLLSVSPEFPYWEDPSLWSVLELKAE
jgi:hypothetical protein